MNKFVNTLISIIAVVAFFAVSFGAGYYVAFNNLGPEAVVVDDDNDGTDLEMPGEVEKRIVTVEDVEGKLKEMAELTTYSELYNVTLGKDETRYLLENIKIFGTTNSITISAQGIVKVGYNMSDFVVKVDDDKIYISVPQAQLNDNYIIWDTVECSAKNNILNPIDFSQYQEIIAEIEAIGLKDAEDKNIYDKADQNVKKIMDGFLSEFVDYEIIYM